jgi:hypothetical protein
MKVVMLSASRTGRLYPQEVFLVLIFTRDWVGPRAMVWSEGNMSLKNPVTPPGIDPGTVRLVAHRLNHYTTPGPHFIYLGWQNTQCSNNYREWHVSVTIGITEKQLYVPFFTAVVLNNIKVLIVTMEMQLLSSYKIFRPAVNNNKQ